MYVEGSIALATGANRGIVKSACVPAADVGVPPYVLSRTWGRLRVFPLSANWPTSTPGNEPAP